MKPISTVLLACILAGCASSHHDMKSASTTAPKPAASTHAPANSTGSSAMQLGNFSISLTVKDIAASRAFYEKLGFAVKGGNQAQNWLILQNDTATIGLFQGMFDKNMLTFNPGWDRNSAALAKFDDVRDIQKQIKANGLTPTAAADESTSGPAHLTLVDPDGNPILIDQHVPKPK